MNSYFITGIGTGIGKTIISAILVRKLQAAYWKPIQAGSLEITDSHIVKSLASFQFSPKIFKEAYSLTQPMSPHAAAKIDNITIDLNSIEAPQCPSPLIIEGAGGLMVPLNEKELVIDLAQKLSAPVIVVSRFYLGSINHTLLTIEALKARKMQIAGIVFNGTRNVDSEDAILRFSGQKKLGHIPDLVAVTAEVVAESGTLINL